MTVTFDYSKTLLSDAASEFDFLLDEDKAAFFLGLSAKTLRKWRCVGGGPEYVKVGRCVRYERSSLERFVRIQTRRSTSDSGNPAERQ